MSDQWRTPPVMAADNTQPGDSDFTFSFTGSVSDGPSDVVVLPRESKRGRRVEEEAGDPNIVPPPKRANHVVQDGVDCEVPEYRSRCSRGNIVLVA